MSAPGQAEPLTPIPRWVAPLFAVVGIGLVPWTIWVAYDLPQRHLARHWDMAWGGFDVAMACLLLATAFAAVRRGAVDPEHGHGRGDDARLRRLVRHGTAARGREQAMASRRRCCSSCRWP